MFDSLKSFFSQEKYPQAIRMSWNVPISYNDKKVLNNYAILLESKLNDLEILNSKSLMDILDRYNDELEDTTFQTKSSVFVDVSMALRWYTMLDWIQTANQLLFSKLSSENRRSISTILSSWREKNS